MRPSNARFNTADLTGPNSVVSGDFALKAMVCANGGDLGLGQFRSAATLPAIRCTVADFISMVVFAGVPPKVAKVIVLWVSIVVASFHPVWARTNERRQNQSVGAHGFGPPVFPQKAKRTPIRERNRKFFYVAGFGGSYATAIRNLIKAIKSGDWLPVFHPATIPNSVAHVNAP